MTITGNAPGVPEAPGMTPFTVRVPESDLRDLRQRLELARLPDAVTGAGWRYGTDLDYLRSLLGYWRDGFDWRAQERAINRFDHFRMDGLHLIHQPGRWPEATPLLLLHGWPSSFLQMLKILPLLGDFHVVVPSLPGFGFSDRPSEPGVNIARVADRLAWLMAALGHRRYLVRASDLGAGVAAQLALRAPGSVIGLHTTGVSPALDLDRLPADLSPAEQRMIAGIRAFREEEYGYALQQSTRPQSLAVGLNDSPAGLAAWLVEKYRAWSDDFDEGFSRDEVLAQITLYWLTQTIGSSMRIYYENAHVRPAWGPIGVPVGVAVPAGDVYPTPREWFERQGQLVHFTELPRGGHFVEHEQPQLLADDLNAFREAVTSALPRRG